MFLKCNIISKCVVYRLAGGEWLQAASTWDVCFYIYTNIPSLVPSTSSADNRTPTNHNPPHPRHHFLQLFSIHQFQQQVITSIIQFSVNILTLSKLLSITSYHYKVITRGYSCCSASAESRNSTHENHSWAQTTNFQSPNESFWINSKK